jgi:hypothetical protein
MPSAQDCAERLREQAYRTLLPQIRDLEAELQNVNTSLSAGIQHIERKLEALRQIELPTAELILGEILGEIVQQKEQETNALALFAHDLCRKETQEEILTFLLDSAKKFSPRLVLFAVRGDRLVGWSSRGCADDVARSISADSFPRSDCPQLWDALGSESPVIAADLPERASLQSLQEAGQGGQWRLFSLNVLQKPVALLLAGGANGFASDSSAISVLIELAALRLENIALRILYELTSVKQVPAAQQMPDEKAAAIESAAPAISSEIPAVQLVSEREQTAELSQDAPQAASETMPVLELVPPAGMAEEQVDAWTGTQTQAADSIAVPPLESQPIPEEEKLHTEAKRFARLLVSEIKLYNEHHVVEGRQNQDLYLRLKKDIDRSREMYEKRVSPSVSRKIDYFHDEIIRILGDNDPTTLGIDYPGPRGES